MLEAPKAILFIVHTRMSLDTFDDYDLVELVSMQCQSHFLYQKL